MPNSTKSGDNTPKTNPKTEKKSNGRACPKEKGNINEDRNYSTGPRKPKK